MKWTNEQVEKLKQMCYAGTSNAELAKEFGVPLTEVHAKRSALGITRAKCAAGQPTEQRAAEAIEAEILKVRKLRKDAEHKIRRADDRLSELYNELYDALYAAAVKGMAK